VIRWGFHALLLIYHHPPQSDFRELAYGPAKASLCQGVTTVYWSFVTFLGNYFCFHSILDQIFQLSVRTLWGTLLLFYLDHVWMLGHHQLASPSQRKLTSLTHANCPFYLSAVLWCTRSDLRIHAHLADMRHQTHFDSSLICIRLLLIQVLVPSPFAQILRIWSNRACYFWHWGALLMFIAHLIYVDCPLFVSALRISLMR
jgi:hypothetical protein